MTPRKAKQLLPIIEAFANGQAVQVNYGTPGWTDETSISFGLDPSRYRIKPVEPHDAKWASEQMLAAKSVRRRSWINSSCHCFEDNTGYVTFRVGNGVRADVRIRPEDILADDWELYEPK